LSGLITPSLDEMVYVAKEMKRRGFNLPLLIGGATTSPQHTAVKIAPEYHESVVHVLDASRAVGVVSNLLDPERKRTFDAENRAGQANLREVHGRKQQKPLLTYPAAMANRLKLDWRGYAPPVPAFLGRRRVDVPLGTLVPYIDWTFFFSAWELKGRFPQIFDHPEYGPTARELYDNATTLLKRIIDDGSIQARGVYGFWPAERDGDDIVLFEDDTRAHERLRFNMLRQQSVIADDKPNRSLADFIAPRDSGRRDYLGTFAVTAGLGAEELAHWYEAQNDDYQSILVKALADRLAEAFAEYLHQQARRDWGYGVLESWSNDDLIEEKYRGIRPAFGYPACPDHTEKRKLFALLDADGIGMRLTESCAMLPPASVSGIYFSHPEARYFMVGRLGRDQVEDYARRKGIDVAEAERWLGPNLAYDPAATLVGV
jgi:5-methyltetrahydrofolate--homocysteine methyltransferase